MYQIFKLKKSWFKKVKSLKIGNAELFYAILKEDTFF